GRVRFTGALAHEAALDAMAAADLVVVPSLREGCGVVALEAAALGVPVVATATGVMAEVTCAQGVVPPGDVPALAVAMREMLAAPALREHCSSEGRERVAAGFTWDVIARSTLAVYERVLGSGA
ncbi:MAG: glycosyltransferase, partial [Actinobacteria bacterium]